MYRCKMKTILFVFAAVHVFYTSAQSCASSTFPIVETATIAQVNVDSSNSNLFAVTRCEVIFEANLGERLFLVVIVIDIQGTVCLNNSGIDPSICDLIPITNAETATCTSTITLQVGLFQNIQVQCFNTNVTTPAITPTTPVTTPSILVTTLDTTDSTLVNTPTPLDTTDSTLVTTPTPLDTTDSTLVTTPTTTVTTPTTTATTTTKKPRKRPSSSSSSSSSSSESDERSRRCKNDGRRICRRRSGHRRRRGFSSTEKKNNRQRSLTRVIRFAPAAALKTEENQDSKIYATDF
ncbi:mucin-2-like [Leucoraja erinacea]|uniref:mucin-2-like n=1 Tax=Leucoraja erinaceus TaxID=7782 RepID=UPI00245491BB|nr:mucin-2-like [Leucoraja erinacea]